MASGGVAGACGPTPGWRLLTAESSHLQPLLYQVATAYSPSEVAARFDTAAAN